MPNLPELKKSYFSKLKNYPFENKEEAKSIGMPLESILIVERDGFTALESPFTFKSFSKCIEKKNIENNIYIEDESSEGQSSDENCFYNDVQMSIDLFVNGKQIVDNCDLTLVRGNKYGLVGRNGIGKTTLLKAIRKRKFGISKSLKIHMIKQDYVSDEKIIDFVGPDSGRILQSLGFQKHQLNETLRNLSGGWRMRAQLAKAIFMNPDLLLLDEPTNFLDIKSIDWLEKQIPNMKTVIIVSHDRNFLNNTVDHTLYLNNFKIEIYKGNYASFKQQKDSAIERQIREYENQKMERDHIQKFIDRFRYNAKRSSQAQSRIKLLEKMEKLELPKVDPAMKFRFDCEVLKGILVEIEHSKFSYSKETEKKEIFTDLNIRIDHKSRIVIVGEKGQGKSTLLKLLTQRLKPDSGKIDIHPSLKVGYFAQHHVDHLDHNQYALSYLMKSYDEHISRSALSNFSLQVNNQKIRTLSGGQKSRLAFASISLEKPNLLLLDEPTNHLDMETIDALADSLNKFEGAVVCVSHDLAFLEKVFNEVYICERKELLRFKGTVLDYKNIVERM